MNNVHLIVLIILVLIDLHYPAKFSFHINKKKKKNKRRRKNFDRYSRRYKELQDRRTKEEFTYNEATSGQDEIVSRHYSQTIVVHAARVVSRKVSIPVDE